MSTKIDAARSAGYSDDEIIEFLSEKDSTFKKNSEKAKNAGYSSSEIINFFEESKKPSKIRSFISAPLKGLIKGTQHINPLLPPGPVSSTKALDKSLPIRKEHEFLEKAGELAPYVAMGPESIPLKLAQLGVGVAGRQIAKQMGAGELGQSLTEAGSLGIPGLTKAAGRTLGKTAKNIFQKDSAKLPSGLTKLKAVESKSQRAGIISKTRQESLIEKLNKEASDLTKKSVKKHIPIAEKIEKGVDFENNFKKGFAEVQNLAKKYPAEIDIGNINKFLIDKTKPFRGISKKNLSSDARAIINESEGFISRRPANLDKLMTLYRQNNRKITRMYEKGKLTGVPKDKLDFLLEFNKEIAKSFSKTLPEDSVWLKKFQDTNKEFAAYKKAQGALDQLKGILSGSPTKSEVTKLAIDPRTQKKLALKMGDKGSEEIISIAKDLKTSIESLKKIPRSQLSKFDAVFPIYYLIPWIGKVFGSAATINKAIKFGRYGYGYWLSTPEKRKVYQAAIKALNANDLEGYRKAAHSLTRELEKKDD